MSPRRQTALLFFLTLVALLPGIGAATGITGKDEFYLGLRTPMEMLASDHWLVPFLDGVPRIRKPPLLYWLGSLSFAAFGPSLASARFIAALFGALLVVATAGIARRLGGDVRTALGSGLILLGCLGLHSEGRRFMLDVPVAALSTAAFWSALVWLDGRRWPWLTLTALLLAAGFLVKGPIVALVCGGGLTALLLSGRLALANLRRHGPALVANGALLLALALPWFLIVRRLYPEALHQVLADELESRQLLHLSPDIMLGLVNVALPWVFVFLAGAWQRRREPDLPRLLLLWFLLTFLPFLFLRSFDRYLIGSLVPLAIFLALSLDRLRSPWPFRFGAAVALLLGGGLAAFAFWFNLGGWFWLPLPAAYLAWAWWRAPAAPVHVFAAPLIFWVAVLAGVFPALGVNAVPEAVVELGRQRTIALYDGPQPALLPILARQPHRHYASLDRHDVSELAALDALIFAEGKDVPQLRAAIRDAGYEAVPAGHYATLASHGSGLRFARVGATAADWRAALGSRQLDPLHTRIEWFALKKP